MPIDQTKIGYSSAWDIDQLYHTDEVSVSAGDNSIYAIPAEIGYSIPTFEIQFQPVGSSKWYQAGTSSSNNTVAGAFTAYGYIQNGNLHAVTPAGTVRLFVWADKVDY